MRRRDEARGGGARLAGERLGARVAHRVARLAHAADHARAHDVLVERQAERLQLGCGAREQRLRLLLERLARLAFEPEIDEALALPVEYPLAHALLSLIGMTFVSGSVVIVPTKVGRRILRLPLQYELRPGGRPGLNVVWKWNYALDQVDVRAVENKAIVEHRDSDGGAAS